MTGRKCDEDKRGRSVTKRKCDEDKRGRSVTKRKCDDGKRGRNMMRRKCDEDKRERNKINEFVKTKVAIFIILTTLWQCFNLRFSMYKQPLRCSKIIGI
jgi:hypothetical protein